MADGVMIAFLPTNTDWCRQELPHLTLVYAGDKDELRDSALSDLAKDAMSVARLTGAFSLEVTGVETFGDDAEKVDVLTLYPTPQLLLARKMVEGWNASQYKDYKPHATIGPEGSALDIIVPSRIGFDRVVVSWGDKHVTFRLTY